MWQLNQIIIACIHKLEMNESKKQKAIIYLNNPESSIDRNIMDKIPSSFGSCGFDWSSSPQGVDFWLSFNRPYNDFINSFIQSGGTLEQLMYNIPRYNESPLNINENLSTHTTISINTSGYVESNLDRVLYILSKMCKEGIINKTILRLVRKDLKQLKRKGKINIVYKDFYTDDIYKTMIDKLLTWSNSKRDKSYGRGSFSYSNLNAHMNSFILNNSNVCTEPIPYLGGQYSA